MDKKLSGILDEILNYVPPNKDRSAFIEGRAQQLIGSAIHLIKLINETYEGEDADDLVKRLVRSISSGDENKFCRKIRALRETSNPITRKIMTDE